MQDWHLVVVWLSPCRKRPNTQENACWLPQSDHIHRRYSFPDQTRPGIRNNWPSQSIAWLTLGLVCAMFILHLGDSKRYFFLKQSWLVHKTSCPADLDGRLPLDCVGKNGADSSYQLQCFGFFCIHRYQVIYVPCHESYFLLREWESLASKTTFSTLCSAFSKETFEHCVALCSTLIYFVAPCSTLKHFEAFSQRKLWQICSAGNHCLVKILFPRQLLTETTGFEVNKYLTEITFNAKYIQSWTNIDTIFALTNQTCLY